MGDGLSERVAGNSWDAEYAVDIGRVRDADWHRLSRVPIWIPAALKAAAEECRTLLLSCVIPVVLQAQIEALLMAHGTTLWPNVNTTAIIKGFQSSDRP